MIIKINFDGGLDGVNGTGSAIPRYGYVAVNETSGEVLTRGYGRKVGLPAAESTNNVAEYLGLIEALTSISEMSGPISLLIMVGDSKLIIEQMAGRWRIKAPHLKKYYDECWGVLNGIGAAEVRFVHTLRAGNSEADGLSRLG